MFLHGLGGGRRNGTFRPARHTRLVTEQTLPPQSCLGRSLCNKGMYLSETPAPWQGVSGETGDGLAPKVTLWFLTRVGAWACDSEPLSAAPRQVSRAAEGTLTQPHHSTFRSLLKFVTAFLFPPLPGFEDLAKA